MPVLELSPPGIPALPRIVARRRRPLPRPETEVTVEDLPFAVHLDQPVSARHAIWLPLIVSAAALIAMIV